jgi:hypothetical protein
MLTRKTQYAWMSLGGLICLFCLVLACKLRDGNRANAQPEELPPPIPARKEASPSIFTLPPTLSMKEPELLPPPKKADKTKEQARKEKSSEPKATLEMPMPSEPPPLMTGVGKEPTPPPLPEPPPLGAPELSPILPASFGPNTPTPPETTKFKGRGPFAADDNSINPAATRSDFGTKNLRQKKRADDSLHERSWNRCSPQHRAGQRS